MKVSKDKKVWDVIDKKALETIMEDEKKPRRIAKGYLLSFISDKVKIHSLNKFQLTNKIIEL